MYISKILLKNIRCFSELEIDFSNPGESILISADNGDGKTTLLRCIAMGLCDKSSAAALHRELVGELVRRNQEEAEITIELANGEKKYQIITTIKSLRAFESISQELKQQNKNSKEWRSVKDQDKFPWKDIFVSGYGAGRQTQGTADFREYVAVDAVYSLFNYQAPLQNPELALRRLIEKARERAGKNSTKREELAQATRIRMATLLRKLLDLDAKDEIILSSRGIDVKGHWGRMPIGSIGDGYQSAITWILDLFSWKMLSGRSTDTRKMFGIVLIDELEQHLHPRWQRKIVDLLDKTFPKLQFITTTHSPLLLSGCEHYAVHTLHRGKHQVHQPHGWLAEDIYQKIMGTKSSRPPRIEELIEEFEKLHLKSLVDSLSKEEKCKLKSIRKKLAILPGSDVVGLTTKLDNLMAFLKGH